jgi:hypothetical protein
VAAVDVDGISRRRFIQAAAGTAAGTAAVGALSPAVPAGAASPSVPAPVLSATDRRLLTYAEGTGASVTASPAGDLLIAEVQGVLWSLPAHGGEAVQLTDWELEPTRPVFSPDGSAVAFCSYRGGGFHIWTMGDAPGTLHLVRCVAPAGRG